MQGLSVWAKAQAARRHRPVAEAGRAPRKHPGSARPGAAKPRADASSRSANRGPGRSENSLWRDRSTMSTMTQPCPWRRRPSGEAQTARAASSARGRAARADSRELRARLSARGRRAARAERCARHPGRAGSFAGVERPAVGLRRRRSPRRPQARGIPPTRNDSRRLQHRLNQLLRRLDGDAAAARIETLDIDEASLDDAPSAPIVALVPPATSPADAAELALAQAAAERWAASAVLWQRSARTLADALKQALPDQDGANRELDFDEFHPVFDGAPDDDEAHPHITKNDVEAVTGRAHRRPVVQPSPWRLSRWARRALPRAHLEPHRPHRARGVGEGPLQGGAWAERGRPERSPRRARGQATYVTMRASGTKNAQRAQADTRRAQEPDHADARPAPSELG